MIMESHRSLSAEVSFQMFHYDIVYFTL